HKDEINSKYIRTPDAKEFPPFNTVSMYYSMFQSCLLKTKYEIENKRYDWVIKSRSDFALNGKIPFENMESNKLYVPSDRLTPQHDFANDQFAVGSSSVMNKYMSTWLN